jgi:uncharacterized repeat protein (TIGR01451 family)
VIDAADAPAAVPIINAWQALNPTVKVHEASAVFSGDVARLLVVAPKVAMHADGNQGIARSYLMAAGIPDSTLDPTWPNTSPDMLDPTEVMGPTTSNHHDGKLFDAQGQPVYCQFMSMHWAVNSAIANPEVVAEVRQFLSFPVHFFAECQAVNAFENLVPYGFFLTTTGFSIKNQPNLIDNYNFDSTFAQYDGTFGTVGGSEPSYAIPAGGAYKAGGVTMITAKNLLPGAQDLWMTGYLDGACSPSTEMCGSLGKVSYLGGHQYSVSLPISTHPTTQGTRLFLNSLFDSLCASASGQPVIDLTKSAPAMTTTPGVVFTIDYANSGPTVALGAVVTDVVPPGATFVSATGGGSFAAGKVTWNLGNLGSNQGGSVSFTANLGALGTYNNTAKIAYTVGLNSLLKISNTTSTLYDADTDGDGIVNSLDVCPGNFNPAQDLSSDILSCGACGVVCAVANGTPGCAGGTCVISSCSPGHSDCNGLYADGCEYADAGFASDPGNCGACGVPCAPANASGACLGGACGLGQCNPGHSNCNNNPADGCEYNNAGFASDPSNCGGCGVPCAPGFVCAAGACAVNMCPPGKSDCNGLAADGCEYNNAGFASDLNNCGACGIACAPAHASGACAGGACAVGMCNPGYSDCNGLPGDGCEYNNTAFASDTSNCGGCGIPCAPANAVGACNGACGVGSCAPGFSNCNGMAADGCEYNDAGFGSDAANCGGCGNACAPPNAAGSCAAGLCAIGSCQPGFVDLDASPVNGCEYACTALFPSDATCDGVDDDCDGIPDDDYAPSACGSGACTAAATCALGTESCTPGSPSIEGPLGDPSCSDGTDDDCDGLTDAADPSCQAAACSSDSDCDDGNPCTDDQCSNGFCSHAGNGCGGTGGTGAGGSGGSSSTGSGATGGSGNGGSGNGGSGTGGSGTGGSGNGGSGTGPGGEGNGAGGATNGTTGNGGNSSGDPGDKGSCACRLSRGDHGSADGPFGVPAGVALLLALMGLRRSVRVARE